MTLRKSALALLALLALLAGQALSAVADVPKNGLGVSALTAHPGDTLTVVWAVDSVVSTDEICMYASGAPNSSPVDTCRGTGGTTSGSTSVSVPNPLATGAYEYRLFRDKNAGIRLASSPAISVTQSGSVTPTAVITYETVGGTVNVVFSSLLVGSSQTVNWTVTPANIYDNVQMVPHGNGAAGPSYANCSTSGLSSGQVNCYISTGVPTDTYDFVLFSGLGGSVPVDTSAGFYVHH